MKKLTNILKSHRARSHENHVKCGLEASLAECCSSFEQKVIESLACAISFLGTRATARMKANKGLFPWNSLSISKQPEINIAHPQTKQTKKPLTKSIRTMPEISSGWCARQWMHSYLGLGVSRGIWEGWHLSWKVNVRMDPAMLKPEGKAIWRQWVCKCIVAEIFLAT